MGVSVRIRAISAIYFLIMSDLNCMKILGICLRPRREEEQVEEQMEEAEEMHEEEWQEEEEEEQQAEGMRLCITRHSVISTLHLLKIKVGRTGAQIPFYLLSEC